MMKQGTKFYEQTQNDVKVLEKMTSICEEIKSRSHLHIENRTNVTPTLLLTLTEQLRIHYQENYGLNSKTPRPIVIPHASIFSDYRVDGAIMVILITLLEGATIRDLLPYEKLFEKDISLLLPILHDIENNLLSRQFFFTPRVFINKAPINLIQRMSKIIMQHRGVVVASDDEATHVIDWNEDTDQPYQPPQIDPAAAKIVPYNKITVDDGLILHWSRFPDSYNEKMNNSDLEKGMIDSSTLSSLDAVRKQKYYVNGTFIFDCETFNEWGNEQDYEQGGGGGIGNEDEDGTAATNEAATQSSSTTTARGRGRGKRKSGSVNNFQSRMLKETFIPQMIVGMEKYFSDVLPASLLGKTSAITALHKSLDITDSNQPVLRSNIFMESQAESKTEETSMEVEETVKDGNVIGSKRKHSDALQLVSSHATVTDDTDEFANQDWFSMDSISGIERRYLHPVIGTSPEQESSYLQLRNAIVNLYLFNKQQYLTSTECRRKLSGDISRIIRIHEFLDAFGIINQQVKLESCPKHFMEDFYYATTKRKMLHKYLESHFPRIYPSPTTIPSTSIWSPASWPFVLDELLLASIVSNKMDWKLIANQLIEAVKTPEMEKTIPDSFIQEVENIINPYSCMLRFMQLSIITPTVQESMKAMTNSLQEFQESLTTLSRGSAATGTTTTTPPEEGSNGTVASKTGSGTTTLLRTSMVHTLRTALEQAKNLTKVLAEIKETQESSVKNSSDALSSMAGVDENKMEESVVEGKAMTDSRAVHHTYLTMLEKATQCFQTLILEEILNMEKLKAKALEDYMTTRMAMVDNKMRVFSHVESMLLEQEHHQQVERYKLASQRMNLSALLPNGPESTRAAGGSVPNWNAGTSSTMIGSTGTLPSSGSISNFGNYR